MAKPKKTTQKYLYLVTFETKGSDDPYALLEGKPELDDWFEGICGRKTTYTSPDEGGNFDFDDVAKSSIRVYKLGAEGKVKLEGFSITF